MFGGDSPVRGCVFGVDCAQTGMAHKSTGKQIPSRDSLLNRVTELASAFPECTRKILGAHAQFLVRKKTFAYYLHDHHGDGIIAIACKVLPGDNARLIQAHPDRFYMPAYIGSRGWVALRLDTAKVDWEEVRELLNGSYALIAPKRL